MERGTMWKKLTFMVFFISVFTTGTTLAQEKSTRNDSAYLYRDIENFSQQGKFTRFLYGLFFKPVANGPGNSGPKNKVYNKLKSNPYSDFEGKIIRNINIETLDPFGYSIADSLVEPKGFLSKAGNSIHVKSQSINIRNLLLIRKNDRFDSLLVKESERLVRSQGYVHDVSFLVKPSSPDSDSVDLFIVELDSWSIIPNVMATPSSFTFDILEKNFVGLGHEFRNVYKWNHSNGADAFKTRYFIPNIRNTFINTTLLYDIDEDQNFVKSIDIDRPFFSSYAHWAAGIGVSSLSQNELKYKSTPTWENHPVQLTNLDVWAGNAIPLYKGRTSFLQSSNFITTARYKRMRYQEKPPEIIDTLHFYSDEDFYLAGLGVSTRKYVMDKYIFGFGLTEDVPIGKVYSFVGGYQIRNHVGRLYFGTRVAHGDYYRWGYLSTSLEYGTFFRDAKAEQGVIWAGVNYFTDLQEIGKWKFRQFAKFQLTFGLNRLEGDNITLNDGYGLNGFNSEGLTGTNRILLSLQTQSYAPWNFIGFRFGPYLNFSMGMLGNSKSGFSQSTIYSQIGLGVLIRNDYLVMSTFQISISFYPSIPGVGEDVFKTNSIKTTDFGFRDFEIGKPSAIDYQ